jgi:hypothetical protein
MRGTEVGLSQIRKPDVEWADAAVVLTGLAISVGLEKLAKRAGHTDERGRISDQARLTASLSSIAAMNLMRLYLRKSSSAES